MTTQPIETGLSTESRNWGAIGHLSAFVQFIGIPSLVGPLVVWLMKKDDPFAADQAKEALNFNISMAIYFVASLFAIIVLVGILLVPVVVISWFVLVIVGTIRASNGVTYRYPATIRFID
ncbi:MAG: DUF4870 domain-containing protein [Acidimicrobiia bacterium]